MTPLDPASGWRLPHEASRYQVHPLSIASDSCSNRSEDPAPILGPPLSNAGSGYASPWPQLQPSTDRFCRTLFTERALIPFTRAFARYSRARVFGEDLIPRDGPVIYVGKHPRSYLYLETVLLGIFAFWDSGRPAFRVLESAHATTRRAPLLTWIRRHVGAIPATERHALERKLHALVYEEQPYTFLTNRPQLDAIKNHVRGIHPSLAWYDLRKVWLLPPGAKRSE